MNATTLRRYLWGHTGDPLRDAPPLDPHVAPAPPTPRLALLINPFYAKSRRQSLGRHNLIPPQAPPALAAASPREWEVRLWDENLLQGPPPSRPVPAVVGITTYIAFARRAYELAEWYRRLGSIVVLGGPHVQACPDEAAAHADAISLGNGVRTWPRILADVEAGRLRARYGSVAQSPSAVTPSMVCRPVSEGSTAEGGCATSGEGSTAGGDCATCRIQSLGPGPVLRYDGDFNAPFDDEPVPQRGILPKRDFLTTAGFTATRGCRSRCEFCYLSTKGLRMPWRTRDPQAVAAEFAATGEPYGVFLDNNLSADPAYLRQLCDALRPLRRIWSAAVTADVGDDPSLVGAMASAGCTGVFIGFETLGAGNLDTARKVGPRPDAYERQVRAFHDAGIQINGSFVFGFDEDGPDVFARTMEWIERVKLECATFHILTPYPGTPLHERMDAEGRILTRDTDQYDTGHVVFRPRRMTPEELEAGYTWCYRKLYEWRSIWQRRPSHAGAGSVASYLVQNLLYKKINPAWPLLTRLRLSRALWRPLIVGARWRHVLTQSKTETRPGRIRSHAATF